MGKQSKRAFRWAGHIRIGKRRSGSGHERVGLAISLALALFVALALPVATFAANSNTVAVVRSSGADLYDAPDGAAIQSLARGSALEAIGRTADGAWLKVTTADGVTGWTPGSPVGGLCGRKSAGAQRCAGQTGTVVGCGWQQSDHLDDVDHRHRDHRGRIAEPARRPRNGLRDHRRPLSRRNPRACRSKQIDGVVGRDSA